MTTLCGLDCCTECGLFGGTCKGCRESDGHPCGGDCVAAACVKAGGTSAMEAQEAAIVREINALGLPDLSVSGMNLLIGAYVNLEYPLPNGQTVKLLRDDKVYWANQIERPGNERCYGVVADEEFLLVCEYGCEGADPVILLYKKRG